jgi:methylase of polypeptide subunit release factors
MIHSATDDLFDLDGSPPSADAASHAPWDASFDDAPVQALLAKHAALPRPFTCRFGVANLLIDEGVFCPTLTNASPLLLQAVDFRAGERVLDVFAGSGAFGINAALRGAATVVTIDIAAQAVACTRKNARRNHVRARVDAREGTMRQRLTKGERFDLIVANPPLLPGEPVTTLGAAVFDPELQATADFIRALPAHLARRGRCYLLTSSVLERCGYDIDRLCVAQSLTSEIVAKADAGYECYRVHKITWRNGSRDLRQPV